MENLLHPFAGAITVEEVMANKAFPLVRELAHKYQLKVIGFDSVRADETLNVLNMARDDGLILCNVCYLEDKEAYAIRNCIVMKERGRSANDKLTYFAKRVPHLMKIIEAEKMIPKDAVDFFRAVHASVAVSSIDNLADSYGEVHKTGTVGGEIIHSIMEIAFGNRPLSSLSRESIDKVQSYIDKYREVDKTRATRMAEFNEIFSKPLWVIGYDDLQTFFVAKFMFMPKFIEGNSSRIEHVVIDMVEPFRRLKDIVEIPELIPTMSMIKTVMEQKYPNRFNYGGESGFFPIGVSNTVHELSAMFYSNTRWGNHAIGKPHFLIVPT